MNKIGRLIWMPFQLASVLAAYFLLAALLAVGVGHLIPHYDEYRAIYDVQMVWIVWMLYDRYYGPYSVLLRRTAKTLRKAQQAEEDF